MKAAAAGIVQTSQSDFTQRTRLVSGIRSTASSDVAWFHIALLLVVFLEGRLARQEVRLAVLSLRPVYLETSCHLNRPEYSTEETT